MSGVGQQKKTERKRYSLGTCRFHETLQMRDSFADLSCRRVKRTASVTMKRISMAMANCFYRRHNEFDSRATICHDGNIQISSHSNSVNAPPSLSTSAPFECRCSCSIGHVCLLSLTNKPIPQCCVYEPFASMCKQIYICVFVLR